MDDIKNTQTVTRTKQILEIKTVERLEPTDEGMDLNEGYEYEIDGSIPQLADGLAKMAIEMDKDPDLGEKAGGAFLALVLEYYNKLLEGEN